MSRSRACNLVLHSRQDEECQAYLFSLELEASTGNDAPLPDDTRKSSYDAVKFMEVIHWLSQQLFLRNKDNQLDIELHIIDMHLKVLQYLRYSYAYRGYLFFNAEYAAVVRLQLIEENKHLVDYEPDMATILERMQKAGFFTGFDAAKLQGVGKELTEQWEQKQRDEKEQTSYREKQIQMQPYKPYFKKLGVNKKNNAKAPEDYLLKNVRDSEDESLLHVRQCEDIGCSMNPKKSPFVKLIPKNARTQIIESVLEQHPDSSEPFLYGGFASGLLLRDLEIIKELIFTAKRKNIELFFIDKSYATFIKTVLDGGTPAMEEHIDTTFLYKSLTELATWLAGHLDESNPLNIHFFSDIADAQKYLEDKGKKLTLLVGQDFFTDDGCHSARYSTPGAHEDFMRLARSSLGDDCRYFLLPKNDLKNEVYSHKGTVKKNKDIPLSSKLWNWEKRESKIYKEVPFAFFAMAERNSQKLLIERQYDDEANVLAIKRQNV